MTNILILGKGAREEVIKEKLGIDKTIFTLNPDVNEKEFANIKDFCQGNQIDLVIPSTEAYLCAGIKDYLQREIPEIKVFGPNKEQAKIEGSKYFSKNLMTELELPTADFKYFKTHTQNFILVMVKIEN